MKTKTIINVLLSLIIPSIHYVYYYPWLYNKINYYTKRGEDLNDEMDFINVFLMFIITLILIVLFTLFIMLPYLKKK